MDGRNQDKNEDTMQAELSYNPRGGQVVVRHELDNVVALLSRCGWSVALRETSKPMEATELARHAVHRGAKVVIAAGGDGTVNDVANGLFNTDVALGVLPMGTTNSWALQEYYQCSEIVIESACSLPVHVDGEPFAKTPVAISTVPSH